ncbi:hypothetical protein N9164_07290 [Draconibacterium sp.]|nr:hypothetical protein [Draconibacterium sp.]
MHVDNHIDNSYGKNPMLKTYNKMGRYNGTDISIRVNCFSKIESVVASEDYLNLYGIIDEIGIFNEDNCEVKFKYDRKTESRIVFCKMESDFYILVLYGINGNILEKDRYILIDFEEL